MVWKLLEDKEEDYNERGVNLAVQNLADQALLAFLKIIIEIRHNEDIQRYAKHPEVRKIATPVAPAASASDAAQNPLVALAIYCRDQLQAARTDEEREAAQALVSEIARSVPKSVWSEIRNALPEHMTA